MFGQRAAGFAQKKASAVLLMLNCGKREAYFCSSGLGCVTSFHPRPIFVLFFALRLLCLVTSTQIMSHTDLQNFFFSNQFGNFLYQTPQLKAKIRFNEISLRKKDTLQKMTLNWLSHFPLCSYSLSLPVFTQTSSSRDLWKSNQAKMLNYGKEWKYLPE